MLHSISEVLARHGLIDDLDNNEFDEIQEAARSFLWEKKSVE